MAVKVLLPVVLLLFLLSGCGKPKPEPREQVDAGASCIEELCAAPADSGLAHYFQQRYGLELVIQPHPGITSAYPMGDWVVILLQRSNFTVGSETGLYAVKFPERLMFPIMAGDGVEPARPVILDDHRVAFEARTPDHRGLAVWDSRTQQIAYADGNTSTAYLHGGAGDWVVFTTAENSTRARSLWALHLVANQRVRLYDEPAPEGDAAGASGGTLVRGQVSGGWAWWGVSRAKPEGGFNFTAYGMSLETRERKQFHSEEVGARRFFCGRDFCGIEGGHKVWSLDLETGQYTLVRFGDGDSTCGFPHGGGAWLAFACSRPSEESAIEFYGLLYNGSSGETTEYRFQFLPPPDQYSHDVLAQHLATDGATVIVDGVLMDPQRFAGNATKHVLLLDRPSF